ncbi:MAG: PEP-CTERM sorting domain-containing protein [Calothrix sp. SM1_7_51]|nr:PEP-CTERM sorting domain-containing protein [Calothrix sp. SM1_7_51]
MKKLSFLTTSLVALTLTLGIISNVSKAQAASLVPQQEGEVDLTNLNCLDATQCITDTDSNYGYKVTSIDFDGTGKYGLSRLFVDKKGTSNTYSGSGLTINFGKQDRGTNSALNKFWLRPVAITEAGVAPEKGELEVGRFRFDFASEISEMELSFLDVEDSGITGIVGGSYGSLTPSAILPGTANNAIQTLKLTKVKSLEVMLGNGNSPRFSTGDGVLLSATKVPEPTTVLGLGAIVVASAFGLRRQKGLVK